MRSEEDRPRLQINNNINKKKNCFLPSSSFSLPKSISMSSSFVRSFVRLLSLSRHTSMNLPSSTLLSFSRRRRPKERKEKRFLHIYFIGRYSSTTKRKETKRTNHSSPRRRPLDFFVLLEERKER